MGIRGDNHEAVRTGQATTGRVIIAAASIMICVFSTASRSSESSASAWRLRFCWTPSLLRTILVPGEPRAGSRERREKRKAGRPGPGCDP